MCIRDRQGMVHPGELQHGCIWRDELPGALAVVALAAQVAGEKPQASDRKRQCGCHSEQGLADFPDELNRIHWRSGTDDAAHRSVRLRSPMLPCHAVWRLLLVIRAACLEERAEKHDLTAMVGFVLHEMVQCPRGGDVVVPFGKGARCVELLRIER